MQYLKMVAIIFPFPSQGKAGMGLKMVAITFP